MSRTSGRKLDPPY